MLDHYSRSEVGSILEIPESRLRYWERIQLVKPSWREGRRSLYGFEDLICLRAADGLAETGRSSAQIRQHLARLRQRIPELDDQLAGRRVHILENRVVISRKKRVISSYSGTLLLRFDIADLVSAVERWHSGSSDQPVERGFDEWFQQGKALMESNETLKEALSAFREAQKLDPKSADCYAEMGIVCNKQRKLVEAQRYLRLAILRQPHHARACFHLGNVLDDLNCSEEAVQWYERAVECDGTFPDAYFNLATVAEKLGLYDKAARNWRAYLQLDSTSPFAETARKRIDLIEQLLAGN